ncbi:hypothetical protein K503DRAFT_774838 [Rhizopogon vinicolor AM-OR11-026]|uniref:Uncharacterized protein n=1 Tax=Rhizopogon vinicolor AM-OR11-026 TaxID=1314800 RepID=A0A1B7MNK1_9AGAM|nr:hypothetical protein K503DRAFT_774838 [Rhizopogon vinicolor AM-OR11-026]
MSSIIPYETIKHPIDENEALPLHKTRKPHVKRPKPLPVHWAPPPSFLPRVIFHTTCFCLTFHTTLDFMWEIFKEPKGWENFHVQYLVQLNQLSTVQGLVLTTVAVFITTSPPLKQINYGADSPYLLLSESLVFSLFGLLFQLYTSVVGQSYQKKKTFKALKRNRWLFLCHIMILSIPVYLFGISLLLLIFAISVTGFLSSSTSAKIFTGGTFALLFACLFASILPSPFYTRLYGLLWGKRNCDDNDSDDESDGEIHHEKGAGATVTVTTHEIHLKASSDPPSP